MNWAPGGDMGGGGVTMMDPQAPQQTADQMQMSPELLALLQQIAGTPEAQQLLQGQSDVGLGMYGTPGAQGMHVGGTYTAANPLEHMSVALQKALGANKYRTAQDEMRANVEKQGAARSATMADILEQMLGGGAGGLQPSPY